MPAGTLGTQQTFSGHGGHCRGNGIECREYAVSFPKTSSANLHDANRPGVDEVFERDRKPKTIVKH